MITRALFVLLIVQITFSCNPLQAQTAENFPDSAQLMLDLKILSADSMQGRAVGTKGGERAKQYILSRMQEIGISAYVPEYEQEFTFIRDADSVQAKNLLGYIEGSNAKHQIVLSAHYDHIGFNDSTEVYNGADDNASGVAALLSIAEYFTEHQPENTLVLAFFDGEEEGLRGARHFISSIVFDSSRVKLNVNLDMVSRADNNVLYAVGTSFTPSLKKLIMNSIKEEKTVKIRFGRDIKGKKPYWVNSSDHAPFHAKKIPFVYFGVDDHQDYHKIGDEFEKIDPQIYLNCVDLILQAILNLDSGLDLVVYGK